MSDHTISEEVFTHIGEATMAWEAISHAGTFNSTMASDVGVRLMDSLGLPPDTVLWRDCPTCGGEGVEFLGDDDDIGDACPDCDGAGRIKVNRVCIVPVEVARHLDDLGDTALTIAATLDTLNEGMRALRIGRWVLASREQKQAAGGGSFDDGYCEGWNDIRNFALAAGDGA